MTAPKGLGKRGRALWRSVVSGLPDDWEFDDREAALLGLAARQADDLALLEEAIASRGTFVSGSAGQPVLNPAIGEARQARMAIGRLLGQLELPDGEEEQPRTAAGKRAQRAARARWDREARVVNLRRQAADGSA